MKRSVCAMLTAASMVGCQGTGTGVKTVSYPAAGVGQPVHGPVGAPVGTPLSAAENPRANASGVMQVGYNTGHGIQQNTQFGRQRVAAALPSHGGGPAGPYAQGAMGGMPPYVGGPGGPGGPGLPGVPLGPRFTTGRTQIRFASPTNMKIGWQTVENGGLAVAFTNPQLTAPDRYNFAQGQIYRLKIGGIPTREGVELYPTLEVYPGNAKVDAYLAHNAVAVEFTDEDFDQVAGGNYVTKVIYLPDTKYQELAIAGVETLVSTRLDPGVDPVQEAHRRGNILAVIRIGSVDLEMPQSPPLLPTGLAIPAIGVAPGMGMDPRMGGMPGMGYDPRMADPRAGDPRMDVAPRMPPAAGSYPKGMAPVKPFDGK